MEMDDAGWRYVLATNLESVVGCSRAAIARIRAGQSGERRIILVGSVGVHIKAVGESVYKAAKGGVAPFAGRLRRSSCPSASG
jgi:NAD(P)-dependent dehydrogenase (short-subunit alcohol dehydrogenase family)